MPRFRCPRGALCALILVVPAGVAGQTPRPAGPGYEAGPFREYLLGANYRSLWTTPLSVPTLNPDTFAGGLTFMREGGGRATESLRFRGGNGREYVLRSVDKNIAPAVPPDLRGTLVHSIAQDMISAEHPGAAVVAAPLLRAANVLHASPRLYRVPDHPFLDSAREHFRHRLALLEVRPTDGWAGSLEVEGSDDFQRLMEDDPVNRVHAHAVLTARLMDVYLGDWDRGWDQWRWARVDGDGLRWWIPIPRDRDNAFFHAEGLIPGLARSRMPTLTRFRARIGSVTPFHAHAARLDRLLLSSLPRAAWDSTAAFLRARLTDAVIDSAVARLPLEYRVLEGRELAVVLRARRDSLPEAAERFYRLVSREVDVHVTDHAERAEIVRLPNGAVDVIVYAAGGDPARPHFYRRFMPLETREVRLYMHGGDDQVVVRGADGGIVVPGARGGILIRVIGGGGDDELRHLARDLGRTEFYDDRGRNRVEPGGARVDRREWKTPERTSVWGVSPRDWGSAMSPMVPYADWKLNVGPVIGAGPVWTRYGFRRDPYAQRFGVQALWAPTELGFGGVLHYDRRRTNRPASVRLSARVTNFEDVRFHGFGNDSPDDPDDDDFVVEQTQLQAQAAYEVRPGWWRLFAGPVVKWTSPGDVRAVPPGVRGGESFWQLGGAGGVEFDGRDNPLYTRSGGRVSLLAEGYGTDQWSPFARFTGEAAGYLSVPGRGGPTLALRAGGQAAVGEYPFQESAALGGLGTVRGYLHQRFRGDAAVAGSAELRVPIAYVNLGLARVHLGGFGLTDAGRVFQDGESPGGWHAGYGGGLSFRTLGYAATVAWAYGDRGSLYATLGMPF